MNKNPHLKKMIDEDEEEVEGEETKQHDVPVQLEATSEALVQHINKIFNLSNTPTVGYTVTSNGAVSLRSTGTALLDFFSKCGAMRGKADMLQRYFLLSLMENPSYTMKCLFYMRDVRGGQGERDSFRTIMRLLAGDPFLKKYAARNMNLIPNVGRYDDLIYSFGGETLLHDVMVQMVKTQLEKDMVAKRPSLLAKWLPSENASSQKTKRYARSMIRSLRVAPKKYRTDLTKLRRKINIVESKISTKRYDTIHYDKVPSLAFKKYNKAFIKNDEERFKEFLEQVKKGEKTIKAGTLYPYDIVRMFLFPRGQMSQSEIEALSLQWDALPDYLPEREHAIVVVDTSGSMNSGVASVKPICVAISLGIYIGERCSLNGFITFSERPTFQRITGSTLKEKVDNMKRAEWGCSTNIQSVFDLILSMQIKNNMRGNQITKVFIISDMQFNTAGRNRKTNFQVIEEKYQQAGFKRPKLVFWNVNASDNTEVSKDESDTFLISGCSPSILSSALTSDPVSFMMEVLNGKRYKNVF